MVNAVFTVYEFEMFSIVKHYWFLTIVNCGLQDGIMVVKQI